MAHITKKAPKLLSRVRRIRGQIEAVERALEKEHECAEILQLVASVRGAVNGLTSELVEDHIRNHILTAKNDAARAQEAEELINIIRSYMK